MENSDTVRQEYQEDFGYEILGGRLVNMSPASRGHNRVVGMIYRKIADYLEGKGCEVYVDGFMVHLSEQEKVVPDVMVICKPEIIEENGVYGAPDLLVEVLSPSTALNDKGYKKNLYEKNGVREYWLVDIKNRSVDVYRLTKEGYTLEQVAILHTPVDRTLLREEQLKRIPQEVRSCIFPDLVIPLEELFKNV